MPATVKLLQTFKVTLIMVTFVHNFTVSVPPVCSDAYFLQCLDMTCIQAMDAVMMDLTSGEKIEIKIHTLKSRIESAMINLHNWYMIPKKQMFPYNDVFLLLDGTDPHLAVN